MAWQFVAKGIVLSRHRWRGRGCCWRDWGVAWLVRISRDAVPRLAETWQSIGTWSHSRPRSRWLTGCLFAMAPALSFSRANLQQVLKDGSRTSSTGSGRLRLRSVLVTAELAIALVLLAGAGLLTQSFGIECPGPTPAGFDPERIVVMKLNLSSQAYNARPAQEAYLQQLLDRVRAPHQALRAPGVPAPPSAAW